MSLDTFLFKFSLINLLEYVGNKSNLFRSLVIEFNENY